jgi:hypothetical protein
MKLGGVKLNLTYVIIGIVVLILLIALGWYFYRQGKKQVTLQSLPGELPGNPGSGNMIGASNDEIKNIANALFDDMDGFNLWGHKQAPFDQANLLNDSDLIKLYNTFNTLYQKDSSETLTSWLMNENGLGTSGALLIARLKKLNCK